MTQPRQHAGHDPLVAAAQQSDNRAPPDDLHGLLFKEETSPDAVLNVETAPRDGDVDMWVLIELAAIGVHADATGEHALNTGAGPLADAVPVLLEMVVPAIIGGEQEFGGVRDIHGAEYKMGLRACKASERRSRDARSWL